LPPRESSQRTDDDRCSSPPVEDLGLHDDVVRELPRWLKRVPRIEASRLGDAGVVTGAVRRALDQAHGEIRATLV
jgi:hypothetical protein